MAYVTANNIIWPRMANLGYDSPSGWASIDAAEARIAFVLRWPKTGTLKKIGWHIYSVDSPVMTLIVSIETVAASIANPIATTNAGKTLYAAGAESSSITNPSAGTRFDSINGSTGISVTKGEYAAVTIRCTARTSGELAVICDTVGTDFKYGVGHSNQSQDSYTQDSCPFTNYAFLNYLTLEYNGEFVPVEDCHPVLSLPYFSTVPWGSNDDPERRGLKFCVPFNCKIRGAYILLEADSDVDLILYDSDEYTVFSGFPMTISKDKRAYATMGTHYVEFTTSATLIANAWYRLVLLPKDTTDISICTKTVLNDGSIDGRTAFPEGATVGYTTIGNEPTSGSHTWTDDDTKIPTISVVISEIDNGIGGAPRFGDMTGGLK